MEVEVASAHLCPLSHKPLRHLHKVFDLVHVVVVYPLPCFLLAKTGGLFLRDVLCWIGYKECRHGEQLANDLDPGFRESNMALSPTQSAIL